GALQFAGCEGQGNSDFVRHSGEALYNSRMAGQAGTHLDFVPMESGAKWTPAYAGVTKIVVDQSFPK
ncbi:hypothetical protein, partial [Dokdonella sp.]